MNTPLALWINLTLHQAQRCHHSGLVPLRLARARAGAQPGGVRRMVGWWGRLGSGPISVMPSRRSGPRLGGERDSGPCPRHQADTGTALIGQPSYLNESETRAR
jgi:hypothetical protein